MSAKDFQLQLSKEWQDTRENIAEAIAGIGLVLLSGIVRKTPVDTGRARGNWITSVASIDERQLEQFDKSGSKAINEGASKLESYSDTMPEIYIQNNLDYIGILENGWPQINTKTGGLMGSQQAKSGMVALTIAEVEAQFDGDLV